MIIPFVCLTILYFTFNKESYLSTKVYIYTPMREEKTRSNSKMIGVTISRKKAYSTYTHTLPLPPTTKEGICLK